MQKVDLQSIRIEIDAFYAFGVYYLISIVNSAWGPLASAIWIWQSSASVGTSGRAWTSSQLQAGELFSGPSIRPPQFRPRLGKLRALPAACPSGPLPSITTNLICVQWSEPSKASPERRLLLKTARDGDPRPWRRLSISEQLQPPSPSPVRLPNHLDLWPAGWHAT
jgi:hypothetical protein